MSVPHRVIQELQDKIDKIDGGKAKTRQSLPFGVPEIDNRLPAGGLAYGCLHEVAGGGASAVDGAAPAIFVAGIVARTKGPVLWCLTRDDLFAPALAQVGLSPDRVIYCQTDDEAGVLETFEEGLRFGGLGAVVGEIVRLPMVASRRLQLAAEGSGTMGIAIRRWRRQSEATDFGMPTASMTRWRVSPAPSSPLPVPGIGRPRWIIELLRARAGESFDIEVEACDQHGRMAIPSLHSGGSTYLNQAYSA